MGKSDRCSMFFIKNVHLGYTPRSRTSCRTGSGITWTTSKTFPQPRTLRTNSWSFPSSRKWRVSPSSWPPSGVSCVQWCGDDSWGVREACGNPPGLCGVRRPSEDRFPEHITIRYDCPKRINKTIHNGLAAVRLTLVLPRLTTPVWRS